MTDNNTELVNEADRELTDQDLSDEAKNSSIPSSRSKATPKLNAARFPDARKLRRNASGVVGALNEYECGCAITRDSAGGVFLSACPLHNAAPTLYEALNNLLTWEQSTFTDTPPYGHDCRWCQPCVSRVKAEARAALALAATQETKTAEGGVS